MPTASFIKYRTGAADRWDLLGFRFYGDASNYAGIIAANPTVAIVPVLPPGIDIFVPIITPPTQAQVLPPWLQVAFDLGQL